MATSQDVIALKGHFPEFESIADADVAAVLNTADIFVDIGHWPNAVDAAEARRLWSAHLLKLLLLQRASATFGGALGPLGGGAFDLYVESVSIGERHFQLGRRQWFTGARAGSSLVDQTYAMTLYGLLYMQLRNRNFPAVMVI